MGGAAASSLPPGALDQLWPLSPDNRKPVISLHQTHPEHPPCVTPRAGDTGATCTGLPRGLLAVMLPGAPSVGKFTGGRSPVDAELEQQAGDLHFI